MNPHNTFPMPVHAKMSVENLLSIIGLASTQGNTKLKIESVSNPEDAIEGSIVFITKKNRALIDLLESSKATVLVVPEDVDESLVAGRCFVTTPDPLAWFIKALNVLLAQKDIQPYLNSQEPYIDTSSIISPDAKIGSGTVIEGGCIIGSRSVIGSNCFIARNTVISEDVFIQNNVSIGSVGLGYHTDNDGNRFFFPHLGKVIIGKSAVIGASAVIVRGQLNDTTIGDFTRIGNLVNIGHNVQIGSHSVLSSNVCVAGGATIESYCKIGAAAVIGPKLNIGERSKIGLGSVVVKNIPASSSFFGNPAKPLPTMSDF